MKEIRLSEIAKEELVKEYGENAVKIDSELNELAKLIIKRKDIVQAFNRGNFKAKEQYMKINESIKSLVSAINKKLSY